MRRSSSNGELEQSPGQNHDGALFVAVRSALVAIVAHPLPAVCLQTLVYGSLMHGVRVTSYVAIPLIMALFVQGLLTFLMRSRSDNGNTAAVKSETHQIAHSLRTELAIIRLQLDKIPGVEARSIGSAVQSLSAKVDELADAIRRGSR